MSRKWLKQLKRGCEVRHDGESFTSCWNELKMRETENEILAEIGTNFRVGDMSVVS